MPSGQSRAEKLGGRHGTPDIHRYPNGYILCNYSASLIDISPLGMHSSFPVDTQKDIDMSLISRIADLLQPDNEVTLSVEVDESEISSVGNRLDRVAQELNLERTGQESDFYCGICGWSPISTYPHSH